MLESKYTRRITAKDLLALGVMFESKGADAFSRLAKWFGRDPELTSRLQGLAGQDLATAKLFRDLLRDLKANEGVFVDEADYQLVRQLEPENCIPLNLEHPDELDPKAALMGMLRYEKKMLGFAKGLMEHRRGYNDVLPPLPQVMQMVKAEEAQVAELEDLIMNRYPLN